MTIEVAIVGSGPSGFFAAEALLKSDAPVRVDMFERLPTPFGLVRSGVAPDHQHIKQVVRVFETIARDPAFSFFGNVEVGSDLALGELRARYDAVVLAYGACKGVALDVPGSDLRQSMTATDFVNWYNGHPDSAAFAPVFDHETAVVVGHGNVAIDVARILLSDHDRLAKTDIADHALEALRHSRIRRVHLIGRRGPLQASFTTVELRELLQGMRDVRVRVEAEALQLDPEEVAFLERPSNPLVQRNIRLLQDVASRACDPNRTRELHLGFLASPTKIVGGDRVRSVEFARNRLSGPVDDRRAMATKNVFSIAAGMIISSIGFRGRPMPGVPFDDGRGIVPNVAGRVTGHQADAVAPLYVTGWIKRGANGVIGTNRADAVETIQHLLADCSERCWKPREPRPAPFHAANSVDFQGWTRIDALERAAGMRSGRPRQKIVDIETMLIAARAAPESAVGVQRNNPRP